MTRAAWSCPVVTILLTQPISNHQIRPDLWIGDSRSGDRESRTHNGLTSETKYFTHWRCQGLKCGASRSRIFTTHRRQLEFVVGTDVSDIREVHLIAVALLLRAPSGPKDATTFAATSLLVAMIKRKTIVQGGWVVPPGCRG